MKSLCIFEQKPVFPLSKKRVFFSAVCSFQRVVIIRPMGQISPDVDWGDSYRGHIVFLFIIRSDWCGQQPWSWVVFVLFLIVQDRFKELLFVTPKNCLGEREVCRDPQELILSVILSERKTLNTRGQDRPCVRRRGWRGWGSGLRVHKSTAVLVATSHPDCNRTPAVLRMRYSSKFSREACVCVSVRAVCVRTRL